jgi:Ca2+-binding RTX toxin-like protein
MDLLLRLGVGFLIVAAGANSLAASAAGIATPNTGLTSYVQVTTANDLKPPACAGIVLTDVVSGSGVIIGVGNTNELITGSTGVDTIDGKLGDDCILGGSGDDDITGGNGTDVCIGGGDAGDVFTTCETIDP